MISTGVGSGSGTPQPGRPSLIELVKKLLAYAFSTNAQRFLALLLIPVFVRALSVEEYGIYETALVTINLFSILLNVGMTQSNVRFFASAGADEKRYVIGVGLGMTLAAAVIAVLLFSAAQGDLAGFILGNSAWTGYLWLVLLASIALTINQLLGGILQSEERVGLYAVFVILSAAGLVAMVLVFAAFSDLDMATILISYAVSYLLLTIYLFPAIARRFGISWSWEWFRKMTAFGIPMLPLMLSNFIIRSADRYFILHMSSRTALAVYGLGYRLGNIFLLLLVMPLNYALGPHIFRREKDSGLIDGILSRSFTIYLLAAVALGYLIIALGPEMVALMATSAYAEAAEVIPFIVLAQFFIGIYFWEGTILQLERKTWIIMLTALVAGALNLSLNSILVPLMSWRGAALTAIVSNALLAGELAFAVALIHPVKLEWRRVAHLAVCAALLFSVHYSIEAAIGHTWFLAPLMLAAAFIFLVLSRFFSEEEWKWFKRLLPFLGRHL